MHGPLINPERWRDPGSGHHDPAPDEQHGPENAEPRLSSSLQRPPTVVLATIGLVLGLGGTVGAYMVFVGGDQPNIATANTPATPASPTPASADKDGDEDEEKAPRQNKNSDESNSEKEGGSAKPAPPQPTPTPPQPTPTPPQPTPTPPQPTPKPPPNPTSGTKGVIAADIDILAKRWFTASQTQAEVEKLQRQIATLPETVQGTQTQQALEFGLRAKEKELSRRKMVVAQRLREIAISFQKAPDQGRAAFEEAIRREQRDGSQMLVHWLNVSLATLESLPQGAPKLGALLQAVEKNL